MSVFDRRLTLQERQRAQNIHRQSGRNGYPLNALTAQLGARSSNLERERNADLTKLTQPATAPNPEQKRIFDANKRRQNNRKLGIDNGSNRPLGTLD